VGLFCIGYGIYLAIRAVGGTTLIEVDAEQLERGNIPAGFYFHVRNGSPRWDLALRGEGSDSHRTFVPVVSNSWTTLRPVAVFLEVLDRDDPLDREVLKGSVTGTRVTGRNLGVHSRRRFAERDIRDASNALILTAGRSPAGVFNEAAVWVGIGSLILILYRFIPKRWKEMAGG